RRGAHDVDVPPLGSVQLHQVEGLQVHERVDHVDKDLLDQARALSPRPPPRSRPPRSTNGSITSIRTSSPRRSPSCRSQPRVSWSIPSLSRSIFFSSAPPRAWA